MWILVPLIALMPFEQNPHLYLASSFLGVIPDFTMVKLVGMLGLCWTGVEVLGGRTHLRLFESRVVRAFGCFLLFAAVASIVNGVGPLVISRLISAVFLLPLVLAAVRQERSVRLAFQTLATLMVVIFPYAYRQMLRFGGRLGVGLHESNYFALSLVLVLPIPFALYRHERVRWRRRLWLVAVVLTALMIILTGSRGGFLGMLVVVLLTAVGLTRRPIASLAAFTLGLSLLIALVPNSMLRRLLDTGGDDNWGVRQSDQSRRLAALAGIGMIRANPFTGVGLGNFKANSQRYAELSEPQMAHNTYIEVGAELGAPALLAFLAVPAFALVSLGRSQKLAARAGRRDLRDLAGALRVGLVGYLVSATFLSAAYEKFFWLGLFLSICIERVVRRRAAASARENAKPAPAQVHEFA
jgi:O-antigen ligase